MTAIELPVTLKWTEKKEKMIREIHLKAGLGPSSVSPSFAVLLHPISCLSPRGAGAGSGWADFPLFEGGFIENLWVRPCGEAEVFL